MPLSDDTIADLCKLGAAAIKNEIAAQCLRVHRAVHDGSLDRPTVDDALARIAVLNRSNEPDEPAPAAKVVAAPAATTFAPATTVSPEPVTPPASQPVPAPLSPAA